MEKLLVFFFMQMIVIIAETDENLQIMLNVVNSWCLGVTFNELADFSIYLSSLAASGTRALGSIINKYKQNNYMLYNTYSKLVQSCVFFQF